MTWISLIGITLAVFALIAVLAVRSGFRSEFVGTILGANAHVSVYNIPVVDAAGALDRTISDYEARAGQLTEVPGVIRAAPVVKGEVMANHLQESTFVQVFGMTGEDLSDIPRIVDPITSRGDLDRYDEGVAIGSGIAAELGLRLGDRIELVSNTGPITPMGRGLRRNFYEVVFIFSAGRYDIDRTRVYMPLAAAQSMFNREGRVDEIEVMVEAPEEIDTLRPSLMEALGPQGQIFTWREAYSSFLRALAVEDNVMFVILSILVLIASMNIISGLIMLVKNKGRDIGILRTMGLTQGSVLRVFFLCGASIGTIGTVCGVILGCLFAIYIDPIFSAVNYIAGGGVWDPSIRGIYNLPAELHLEDVLSAVALSLGLSWTITYFPARRAARMNPVEALRYE